MRTKSNGEPERRGLLALGAFGSTPLLEFT